MTDYMTMVMREAEQEAREREIEARYYRKMHFNNLVSRAESQRLEPPLKRHRFSKEIAEELIAERGAFAHYYCLEKLEGERAVNVSLWRDVLTWIDELTGEEDASN